jgi:hypothetical protein
LTAAQQTLVRAKTQKSDGFAPTERISADGVELAKIANTFDATDFARRGGREATGTQTPG